MEIKVKSNRGRVNYTQLVKNIKKHMGGKPTNSK